MNQMEKNILEHYLKFGTYTYPGLYKDYLKFLPDDISELGNLICHQVIHRAVLKNGNTLANADKKYGDMNKFPWFRLKCDDDILMTAAAMITELFRLDEKGITKNRTVENKIVVTCRYVSVLMSSILKSKGIPTRSRAGFAPYCLPNICADHWINQYWYEDEQRWITIDADGYFDDLDFSQFDIPNNKFCWAAHVWLDIRNGKTDGKQYVYADGKGTNGLKAAIRSIIYDFHAIMNDEISYEFQPSYISGKFEILTENDFKEIDKLAGLLLDPDRNFDNLIQIWNTDKKYRLINSPLIGDWDHER